MPEANQRAVRSFQEIMDVVQQWEDGALTDEEMHNKIDLIMYNYRHVAHEE